MLLGCWKSIGSPLDWKPADVGVLQSPRVGHSLEKPCLRSLLCWDFGYCCFISHHVPCVYAHGTFLMTSNGVSSSPYNSHGERVTSSVGWEYGSDVSAFLVEGLPRPCSLHSYYSVPMDLPWATHTDSQCGSHLGSCILELRFFQVGFHQKLESKILQEYNMVPAILLYSRLSKFQPHITSDNNI